MNKFQIPERTSAQVVSSDSNKGFWIAPGAQVMGRISTKDDVSIWYNAVVRGDINDVVIGEATNIQDGAIIHVANNHPCIIKDYVTVGHQANLHGCTIEEKCLIGINAIVLTGAVVGTGSIIAAGALVKENTVIPPLSLVVGIPGKVVKSLPETTLEDHYQWAMKYRQLKEVHRKALIGRSY